LKPIFENISKVGVVVKNLDKIIKTYTEEYGIYPWSIWNLNQKTVRDMTVGDIKKDYSIRIGHALIGTTIWEIIEPVDDKSIFYKFLCKHGEGLHHLGYCVENYKKTMDFFTNINIKIKQSGNWSGSHFAYLDTEKDLKHIVNIYSTGNNFKYPKPDSIYPLKDNKINIAPFFKEVRQIGIVVNDIKKTARIYNNKYGLGPWELYKYYSPKVEDMYYYNQKKEDQKFMTGATMIGTVELELIEPGGGENIYIDHIKAYGEGLQHISFIYSLNFKDVIKFHKDRGQVIKQRGTINNLTYAYMSTEDDLKIISEPLDIPPDFQMPESDCSYPEK